MTLPLQQPYTRLIGNSALDRYPFSFTIADNSELLVFVNGVLLIEFSTYTLENVTDAGGDVVLSDYPEDGAVIYLLRKTVINQQVDYTSAPFEVESHEGALDKMMRILQELTGGTFTVYDSDGNLVVLSLDLSVTAEETTITINNSGGTDAVLQPWESGTKAGVFHGEITSSAPADGEATTKPDGYVYIEI